VGFVMVQESVLVLILNILDICQDQLLPLLLMVKLYIAVEAIVGVLLHHLRHRHRHHHHHHHLLLLQVEHVISAMEQESILAQVQEVLCPLG